MLALVRLALRLSQTATDDEVSLYISAAISELTHLGITVATDTTTGDPTDPQIKAAIVSYCKWRYGNGSIEEKEQNKNAYYESVKKLQMMTGYGFPEDA